MLGVTNLLTPLSYANAANVNDYDEKSNPISTAKSFSFLMPAHHVYLYATTEANKYFVDYHGNDGASWTMPEQMFTYDESWSLNPNAFVKTWYTWQSWNTTTGGDGTTYTSGQEVKNLTTQESGHYHIYAQWWANGYTIAYDLNQGSWTSVPAYGPYHPTTATYDSGFTVSNPSRTWYSFSGWHITGMDTAYPHKVGWTDVSATEADGITWTSFNNLRATSGTVHFAARWNPDQVNYVINYYQQKLDGTYPETPTDTHTGTATADDFITWALVEYSWFTTPSAQGTGIKPDGTTAIRYEYVRESFNLELIAGRWVKDVTVESTSYSSGGTNSGTHTYSFKYDDQVTLSFELKPWYQTGTWSGYNNTGASFKMPAEHISKTAYADLITYNLTINPTWGSGAIASRTYTVEDENITLGNPTRTHSTFEWWSGWVVDGEQLAWPTKDLVLEKWRIEDRSYIAIWTCDTWYHLEETGSVSESCQPNTNTKYLVEHLEESLTGTYVIARTWYEYGTTNSWTNATPAPREWFTTKEVGSDTIAWDGSTVVQIKYDRNNYTPNVVDGTGLRTTTSGSNDGNAESWKHQYGDTVTLSYTEQSGYTFDHWTVEGSWFDPITLDSGNNTFTMPASDVTIRSYSTTNTYNLTIDKNWGTGGSDNRTYTVEDTITLVEPSRDNSRFVWWSWTDITGDPDPTVSFSWRAYDSSYEAVWDCVTWYTESDDGQKCEANTYTVTINYDDDEHAEETTGFVYDQTGTIANPSKTWYDFAWWTVSWASNTATVDGQPIEGNTSGTQFKNLTTTSGGNVTLTANWTPKTTTEYKVFHYTKNLGSGYTLADSGVFQWTSDAQLTVAELAEEFVGFGSGVGYTGWTVNWPDWSSVTTVTIDRHGTTEIHIYYDRSMYHVYLSGDAHVLSLTGDGDYRFWDTVNVSATVQSWYHFKHWEKRWTGFAELP